MEQEKETILEETSALKDKLLKDNLAIHTTLQELRSTSTDSEHSSGEVVEHVFGRSMRAHAI